LHTSAVQLGVKSSRYIKGGIPKIFASQNHKASVIYLVKMITYNIPNVSNNVFVTKINI